MKRWLYVISMIGVMSASSVISVRKEMGIMATEFELKVHFCPQCKEERASLNKFCGRCGTRIQRIDLILHMERVVFECASQASPDSRSVITRVILKSQE